MSGFGECGFQRLFLHCCYIYSHTPLPQWSSYSEAVVCFSVKCSLPTHLTSDKNMWVRENSFTSRQGTGQRTGMWVMPFAALFIIVLLSQQQACVLFQGKYTFTQTETRLLCLSCDSQPLRRYMTWGLYCWAGLVAQWGNFRFNPGIQYHGGGLLLTPSILKTSPVPDTKSVQSAAS